MEGPKNILVAVDFSDHARSALLQGMRIARSRQSNLHVVHIIESMALGGLAESLGLAPKRMRSESVDEVHERLEALCRDVGLHPYDANIVVRMGARFKELMQVAEETSADMLILGSRGADSTSHRVSKLASNCVRKAPLEVMMVRKAHVTPFTSVCAFVDFSDESQAVVDRATYIARLEKARLMLAHVYLPPWKVMHYMSSTELPSKSEQEAYRRKIIDDLENLVAPLRMEEQGVDVGYELIESSEKVVGVDEYIEEAHFDLVVINTRGRTGIKRILLNTIAEHIVRTSPCSVLALKPADFVYKA